MTNTFSNYRPISLLPPFLTLLETLSNTRLDAFIEKHSILLDQVHIWKKLHQYWTIRNVLSIGVLYKWPLAHLIMTYYSIINFISLLHNRHCI